MNKKENNNWLYNNTIYETSYETIIKNSYYGFIYLITDTKTNTFYIGEKSFHSFRTPKGKKNKKRQESNWRVYPSSNGLLSYRIKENIQNHNQRFKYNILSFCKDKSIMKYVEVKWIMISGAITKNNYLNDNVKINVLTTYKNYKSRVTNEISYNNFLELTKDIKND